MNSLSSSLKTRVIHPLGLLMGLLLWPMLGHSQTQNQHSGIISFSRDVFSVNENTVRADLDIDITGCSVPEANTNNQLSIMVALQSNPGSATHGTDYQFDNPITLDLIDANHNWQIHYTIPIDILDDALVEGNQTVNLAMTVVGVQGFLHCTDFSPNEFLTVTTGDRSTTQLSIVDNDALPPLSVAIDSPQGSVGIVTGQSVDYASTISGGVPPYTVHWDFEGGSPSESTNADPGSVLYATPGAYTTTLTVTDSEGQSQTQTRQITVNATALTVAINSPANDPTIQVGSTVNYTSTANGGTPPYQYNWTFPGGQPDSANVEDPGLVQYNSSGSFTARLVVTDAQLRTATINRAIVVTDGPPVYDLVLIGGNEQSVTVGNTSAPLIVAVQQSQQGNISGQMVFFSVAAGQATLSNAQVITGSNGQAQTTVTPIQSGPIRIIAALANSDKTIAFTLTGERTGTSGLLHNIDGLNANQYATALTIDTICPSRQASAELLARCDALIGNRVSDEVAADALTQIAPEEAISQTTQSVQMAAAQVANVKSRLLALRGGAQGFNASGFALAVDGQVLSGAMLAQAAQEAAHQRGGSAGDGSSDSRWGVFVNGQVKFGDQDATTRESGFDFDTQGLTVGADYRVSDTYIVGAALGFARTGNDMANNAGKVDSDGITGSLYGNFTLSENLYFDWIAQYGWNNYESTRNFNYEESPGAFVIGSNQGDNDGSQYGIDFSLGYDVPMGSLNVGGYGRLSYSTVNIDGYQETSAQNLGLNMRIGEQDIDSLTTALGVRLSYSSSQDWGVLVPQLTLEWEHQYQDDSRLLNVVFVDDFRGLNFQLQTDSPDRNYFNVGLGLSAQFSAGRSAFIQYESILGLDEVDSHSITAGVRIAF